MQLEWYLLKVLRIGHNIKTSLILVSRSSPSRTHTQFELPHPFLTHGISQIKTCKSLLHTTSCKVIRKIKKRTQTKWKTSPVTAYIVLTIMSTYPPQQGPALIISYKNGTYILPAWNWVHGWLPIAPNLINVLNEIGGI